MRDTYYSIVYKLIKSIKLSIYSQFINQSQCVYTKCMEVKCKFIIFCKFKIIISVLLIFYKIKLI